MSKTIVTSLLPALAVAFTLNLHAEPAWTTGSYAPADWQPLDGNILLNVTGTSASVGATGYDSSDLAVLTNGSVPTSTTENKGGIFGFKNGENISWTFAAPKTLEQIRICTCYLSSTAYDGVHIAKVEAMFFGESSWTQVAGESQYNGESSAGKINYTVLTNGEDPVVQNIIGLRITFGTCETGFANYYAEIEAVGFAGATGPVIGAFAIAPVKTKAKVSGTIADVGTDATACDVYLALDGGAATKIAEGVTGSFEHQILGLTAGTTYAYELSVSNNAPTAKGTVQSGTFTTLSASDSTMVWTDGAVPSQAGKDWIVGIQPNAEIDWLLDAPVTLEQLRISSCYLADPHYSGVNIASVKVKCEGSDEWVEVAGSSSGKIAGDGTTQNIICATLTDAETGYIAQNVTALKVVFGAAVYANANYYAEIEAVGRAADKKNGVIIYVL